MGWWNEQTDLRRLRESVEVLEAENARLRALISANVWPLPTECADCGKPVTRALGSPVVLCGDCAGPHVPLKPRAVCRGWAESDLEHRAHG